MTSQLDTMFTDIINIELFQGRTDEAVHMLSLCSRKLTGYRLLNQCVSKTAAVRCFRYLFDNGRCQQFIHSTGYIAGPLLL